MPIHELRETISGAVSTSPEGFGYFTKRINVPEGMRNEILSIDCYNDNVSPWLNDLGAPNGVQVFLSPYPVQRTNESIDIGVLALPFAGPKAGDDTVLYKETSIYTLNDFNEQQQNKVWTERFPNDAVASVPTTTFYSSHLYLTVIIWNAPLVIIS